jgi:hypothetical protein
MSDKVNNSETATDDGLEVRTVSITRGKKTRTFEVREIGYGQINKISAGLNHPDLAKRQQCLESFGANIVSACVYENGNAITFDQASALPGGIGKKLEKEALSLNAMNPEEAKEEAKNA